MKIQKQYTPQVIPFDKEQGVDLMLDMIAFLPVDPRTHVRATKGDRWMFGLVSEKGPEALKEYDKRRNDKFALEGKSTKSRAYDRWKYLETYNQYKQQVRQLAALESFVFDENRPYAVIYLKAMPRTWRKPKKMNLAFTAHKSKPDLDNMTKALLDSLTNEDKAVSCLSLYKMWVPDDVVPGIVILDARPIQDLMEKTVIRIANFLGK